MNLAELRRENLAAWEQGGNSSVDKLDSNIKKNTAFVKKLRSSINADSREQLLKEIKTLSLAKYVSEAVSASTDGLQKCKTQADIQSAVQVISALHRRFPTTYTPAFTYGVMQILQPPAPLGNRPTAAAIAEREKEEAGRITRQRITLRVATELWLAGVLRSVEDGSAEATGVEGEVKASKSGKVSETASQNGFVYSTLRLLLGSDKTCSNLPIVSSLLKVYGVYLLPTTSEEGEANGQNVEIVPQSVREAFSQLFNRYYDHAITVLERLHQNARNAHLAIYKEGDFLNDKRPPHVIALGEQYEKFRTACQSIADLLKKEMPKLDEPFTTTFAESTVISGSSSRLTNSEEKSTLWEDEDARKFYEDILDLAMVIPPALLSPKKKGGQDPNSSAETDNTEESDGKVVQEESSFAEATTETSEQRKVMTPPPEETSEAKTSSSPSSPTIVSAETSTEDATAASGSNFQLDSLLARLPEMRNAEGVNSVAIDFCYLNGKAARRRLVKTLLNIPRTRLDLLPLYARLTATLNPYFADIGTGVIDGCEDEFRYFFHKKKDLLETRIKNVKYLGELCCFKVLENGAIFHNIKKLLDEFNGPHIDVLCSLLDSCGRLLAQSPDTSTRMRNLLDVMMRKKAVQHLDNRQVLMVENAFYQCIPQRPNRIRKREPTPVEAYIHHMLHAELTRGSVPRIVKTLKRLPWQSPDTVKFLTKVFVKVWRFQFSTIPFVAMVLEGLRRGHPDFVISVVDSVVEEIRLGMERNIFKHNQRRIATVKYLAEFYNCRLLDGSVILDTLYTLTTFGHSGTPSPDVMSSMDSPDDFFRIRLCCTIIDACGKSIDKGSMRPRMDEFLAYFQLYILSKARLSLDIEFMIQDTFEMLRPSMKVIKDYEEAVDALRLLHAQRGDHTVSASSVVSEQLDSEGDEERGIDSDEDEDDEDEDEDLDSVSESEDSLSDADSDLEEHAEERTEEGRLRKPIATIKTEEDEQFEAEFSKLMLDTMDSRRSARPTALDFAIPFIRKTEQNADAEPVAGNIAFTLLTKRGSKPQTKNIEVPSDTKFAIATRTKQEAEREEQQRLKKIVLNYEEREDGVQKKVLQKNAADHGIALRFKEER